MSSDSCVEILSPVMVGLGGRSFWGCDQVLRIEHFEQEDQKFLLLTLFTD